ncbi:NEL-type E3 ubiquitin ligase domain-containing protein [Pectobacterium versatile]|uniref:NEL-type E3 ubiquitin ligase domain-containing protein n=1 Tax=Pectobacterium versatile TaxID=2488639 RepID=UPI001CCD08B7|nr:NEL-type E3 ubiquitin ligase domain-containing protein [Pectobacterium versatile]
MPYINTSPVSFHATINSSRINNVRDQQHQSNDCSLWPKMKEWFPQSNETHAEALLSEFYQPATDVSPRDRLFNFVQLKTLLSPEYQNKLVTERLDGTGETVCTIVPSGNDAPTSVALALSEDDHNAAQELITLHEWVCASPHEEAENRDIAAQWIRACWKDNGTSLNLESLELTTLPDTLPQKLKRLDVSNNQLTTLPNSLPPGITRLNANYNQLATLPDSLPSGIITLYVSNNQLTTLPDSLPLGIITLDARYNQLTTLPDSLPPRMTILDVSHNRLTTLPDTLPQRLALHTEGNPLAERTLDVSVAAWNTTEISSKWAAFNDEQNAPAFSAFLDRLNGTKTAKNHPAFKNEISSWLTRLADDNKLREKTFSIATDATANCEDRVIFTYHQMKNAEITHRIESGEDDKDLPKLLGTGREVFRLEQLEHIARKKIQQLNAGTYAGRDVDEIEVFLGYQNSLRNTLELTTITPEMRFFGVSNITEGDLHQAEAFVKTTENHKFPAWFAQWGAWHKTVERIAPDEWEKANDEKLQHYEKTFSKLIETELKPSKLENNDDAIRALGVRANQETQKAVFESMTNRVLKNELSRNLFTPRWELKAPSGRR